MAVNYEGSLKGHRGWVTSLACPQSADSYMKVVSGSRDNTVLTWKANLDRHSSDVEIAIPDRRLEGHSGFVSDVALSNTSEYAVSSSWDCSLRLWNLRNGSCKKFIKHTKDVLSVAFSPDNRHIVSGGRDRIIRAWNVLGECMYELKQDAHSDWVSCVRFSPSMQSPLVVSGGWDNLVKVWDLASGKCTYTLEGHTNYVSSVTVSPDGSLCASAGKDGVVRLWDLNRGDSLYELPAGSPVNQICFSPNRYWICAAVEKSIRIYDLENKELIAELTPEAQEKKAQPECMSITWSADGNTLYSGYTDGLIRVWSVSEK